MTTMQEQSTLATQQPADAHTQPVAQTTITTATTQQAAAADQLIAMTPTHLYIPEQPKFIVMV